MIKSISIQGFRGFASQCTIDFAIPNDTPGSGMTILVGANNSGKTTILEALRMFNCDQYNAPSFSEGKRNKRSEDGITLIIHTDNDAVFSIKSIAYEGSNTKLDYSCDEAEIRDHFRRPYILQSRRFVEYEFYKELGDRDSFLFNQQVNTNNRTANILNFSSRLFRMQDNKEEFDRLLCKVLGNNFGWCIDLHDNGNYFIKLKQGEIEYSSEGLGDGMWSIFTICDALYDSEPGDTIAIDEPELSLHPAYQKKVLELLLEYSQDRQIILSTHSPYFIDFNAIIDGGYLYRTEKKDDDITIHMLSEESRQSLKGLLSDIHQPHTLGLEAKEIFFLEDKIIVTEGQEDVIFYKKASEQLKQPFDGFFFGWGSGGASKIKKILRILSDLGFQNVAAIYDGDKKEEKEMANAEFPQYSFFAISQDDIRDKDEFKGKAKKGCMTSDGTIKEEYVDEMKTLIKDINECFKK